MQIVPVLIEVLESVAKGFENWSEKLKIQCNFINMQRTALLRIARILKKALEM